MVIARYPVLAAHSLRGNRVPTPRSPMLCARRHGSSPCSRSSSRRRSSRRRCGIPSLVPVCSGASARHSGRGTSRRQRPAWEFAPSARWATSTKPFPSVFLTVALRHLFQATPDAAAVHGAAVFLVARVLYVPAYLSGVPGLRSASWVVSWIGLALMLAALR